MNPLDARCNISRNDAICVSQLKNAKHIDPAILQERPDVKIFLPFRFFVYRPEMLFQPNTYNRYLGKIMLCDHNLCKGKYFLYNMKNKKFNRNRFLIHFWYRCIITFAVSLCMYYDHIMNVCTIIFVTVLILQSFYHLQLLLEAIT